MLSAHTTSPAIYQRAGAISRLTRTSEWVPGPRNSLAGLTLATDQEEPHPFGFQFGGGVNLALSPYGE